MTVEIAITPVDGPDSETLDALFDSDLIAGVTTSVTVRAAPVDRPGLEAKLREVAVELRDLGDGSVPHPETLTDEQRERYDTLKRRFIYFRRVQNANVNPGSAPTVMLRIADDVSSADVAASLSKRLAAGEIEHVIVDWETRLDPVTERALRTALEQARSATTGE